MAPIPDQRREKNNLLELKGGFVGKPLGKTLLKRLHFLVGYRYQSKSAQVAPHIAGEMMSYDCNFSGLQGVNPTKL